MIEENRWVRRFNGLTRTGKAYVRQRRERVDPNNSLDVVVDKGSRNDQVLDCAFRQLLKRMPGHAVIVYGTQALDVVTKATEDATEEPFKTHLALVHATFMTRLPNQLWEQSIAWRLVVVSTVSYWPLETD